MIPLTQYDRVIFSSSHTSNSVVCVCDVQLCHFLFFVSPLSGWWFFFSLLIFIFIYFVIPNYILFNSFSFGSLHFSLVVVCVSCHRIIQWGISLCSHTFCERARALFGFSCAHSSTRGADKQSTSPSMKKKIRPLALITHRVARCIYRHWTLYFI